MAIGKIQAASGAALQALNQALSTVTSKIDTNKAQQASASQQIRQTEQETKALLSKTSVGSKLEIDSDQRANILQLL